MNEKLFCISTPQARTYYKAVCVAKEFLDKDHNVVNTTGAIPNGEVMEISAASATVKHYTDSKLNGKLEIINLEDNSVTFSEEYDNGQLVHVSDAATIPSAPEGTPATKAAPIYPGTILKTTKDVRSFYVNGKEIAEETIAANGATLELLGNIPDGEAKEFTENGKVKTEANYLHNKLHGLLIRYDEDGRVLSKETYEQGVLKGPAEYHSYTNRDEFHTACNYKNAVLDGALTVTQQDGTVRERAVYVKGRLHGEHKTFYANGLVESEETYADGKLQGDRKIYFPTSELWYTETYINGRLDGERTEFYPSGKVRLLELYSDGMLNGQRNIYAEDGDLIASEEYHWGNIIHNTEYRPL